MFPAQETVASNSREDESVFSFGKERRERKTNCSEYGLNLLRGGEIPGAKEE